MGIIKQIFGICATAMPQNKSAWENKGDHILVKLSACPELEKANSGIRIEKRGLKDRILVVRGENDQFYAFKNQCSHIGRRRIDPLPGKEQLRCCSVNKSTYQYDGSVVSGPAKTPLKTYTVEVNEDILIIRLS